jgi:hypothetical protein
MAPGCEPFPGGYRSPVTQPAMTFSARLGRWRRTRRIRRLAGIRTWTRPLGGSGLPAEAEAWVRQIEDELRLIEVRLSGGATPDGLATSASTSAPSSLLRRLHICDRGCRLKRCAGAQLGCLPTS